LEHPRISQEPNVIVGKPVIRGTRVTVELVLTREDIQAAQAFSGKHWRADADDPAGDGASGVGSFRQERRIEAFGRTCMVTDKSSFFAWLNTIEPWEGPGPDLDDPPPKSLDP